MNISKLLNPLEQQPLKRGRYESDIDSVPFNLKSWLPVEIIGHIILFVNKSLRRELRLVSQACYRSVKWTRIDALNALRNNGRHLREMEVETTFFKELMEIEPNLGDLILNRWVDR
ncbi:hypothetical protein GQ42DRAFT_157633 [Ramicandelaber brevisporus]|nr:hypothetical protein GQ42DRAFT_157633 [Ramicandelaber brevisporus]